MPMNSVVLPESPLQTHSNADENAPLRWLLGCVAAFHILFVIFIVNIGNTNWIPGLFTEQGVGTFNVDNITYHNQVMALTDALHRQGWWAFLEIDAELNTRLYSLSFAVLSPILGSSIIAAEMANLIYYLAIVYFVYSLGKEIFSHPVGMIASITVGLWPSFLIHTTQLLKTPLLVASTLAVLLANIYLFREKFPSRGFLINGAFYVVSVIVLLELVEGSLREPLIIVIILIGLLMLGIQKIFGLRPQARALTGAIILMVGILLGIYFVMPGFGGAQSYFDLVLQQADSAAVQIGGLRQRFVEMYPLAGSNIDTQYDIHDLDSLVRYFPRAAVIGFFAPFPNMWFEKGMIGISPRVLSGVEALLMYAVQALALLGIWRERKNISAWYLVSVAVVGVMMLGLIVLNIGALFRMRYAFWIIMIVLGAGGFHHIALPGLRVLWANFSGGVKQIIMSEFYIYSPILLVANWDWVLYNFRLPLARELEKHRQNVVLVCPPGRYTEQIQALGFTWHPWNLNRRSIYPWRELLSIIELYKIYRQLRPVAVHHFTIKPILYGSLAARAAQIKTVINNFTGLGYLFSDAPKAAWLRRIVLPVLRRALRGKGFHTAFQNDYDLEHLVSLGMVSGDDTTLIPGTGVNLTEYQPAAADAAPREIAIVFMAARLLWDKGLDEYIKAARDIKNRGIPARFWLAGEPDPGNLASVTEAELEAWRSEGVVELLGHRSDIPELLRDADIAVLPSFHEGVPLFLLEAAASGLPLVASDIEGCRMVVEEGVNGFLIKRGDADGFTKALKALLTEPGLRARMGRESRRIAEQRFDQRFILDQYMHLYRKLNLLHGASVKSLPILLVANWDWVLYNFRLPLARALEENGLNIILVCPPGEYTDRLKQMGFNWQVWNLSRRSINPWRELGAIIELYQLYRQLRPAAVHHFTIKPILYGSLAVRAAHGTVVINNFTGLGYLFSEARKARLLRRIVLPMLRRALHGEGFHTAFQNEHDLKYLVSLGIVAEEDTTLIPGTGVNLEDYQPSGEIRNVDDAPVVILAARLLWDKGLAEFVTAARQIRRKGIPARFWLAGAADPGNPNSVPEHVLAAWREEGIIELLGHRSDIPDLLRQADIAVLPSRYYEGVPLFLLESAASGLPLIASDIQGCRMVIEDAVNGFLIPKGDVANLENALITLLTNAELRQRMGEESRRIAIERFDQNSILSRYIDLYRNMGLLPSHM
ncbi:MAG: glycosyltransferase family 4 protein [Chloroflexi bacterium]|nr:glycosyltransferase family 4 protein [Chloroflexota bacterium]